MTPLRVLIIDDERPARAKLVRLLAADPRFVVQGEARDGVEALEQIEQLGPDVIVLDIQMPGLNGFEVLDALPEGCQPSVVFSTAFDAHALRAFDAHAVDYLLKPYDAPRFRKAMDKVHMQHTGALLSMRHGLIDAALRERRRIAAKTIEGAWVTLVLDEIVRVEASNKHSRVVTRNGEHAVRLPLQTLATKLDDRFVRVHRKELINIDAVARIDPWSHGDALMLLNDGTTVVLTRTYRGEVFARFSRRT